MTELLLKNIKNFTGIRVIELDVMSANKNAISLYKSIGFREVGIFPKAYILPSGEVLDNLSMCLFIPDDLF